MRSCLAAHNSRVFLAAYVTSCVIIGFLLQPVTGLSPAWVALIGATILTVVVETKDVHAVMKARGRMQMEADNGQMAAGSRLSLMSRHHINLTSPLQMVEWDMLLFFCAMFIMIEGAVELGLIDRIAQLLQLIIDTAPVSARKVHIPWSSIYAS